MGSALNTTARQVGSALGAALATSLVINVVHKLEDARRSKKMPQFTASDFHSYDNAWRFMAAIYLLAGVIMIVLFRKPTEEQMAAANEVEFVD